MRLILNFFIGAVNGAIDNFVSKAIKKSDQISSTKNIALPEKNIETTIVASRVNDNGQVTYCTRIWPEYGYFSNSPVIFIWTRIISLKIPYFISIRGI